MTFKVIEQRHVRRITKAEADPAKRQNRKLTKREQSIVDAFMNAAQILSGQFDPVQVAQMIRAGISRSVAGLGMGDFITALDPVVQAVNEEQIASAVREVKGLPKRVSARMKFDVSDPRAIAWARARGGELVKNLTDEQRRILSNIISDGIVQGKTPAQISSEVQNVVGLHDRWATAVNNAQSKEFARLLKTGLSEAKAAAKAAEFGARYATKLRKARATNIARTEIMTASNQGRFLSWVQASDQGLINPKTAKKQWVTGSLAALPGRKQVCDVCAPLSGTTVKWDEPFPGVDVNMPPAHPACRCTAVLVPLSIEEIDALLQQQPQTPVEAPESIEADSVQGRVAADQARARELVSAHNAGGKPTQFDMSGIATGGSGSFKATPHPDHLTTFNPPGPGRSASWTPTAAGRELNERLVSVGREVREEVVRRGGTDLAELKQSITRLDQDRAATRSLLDAAKQERDVLEQRLMDETAFNLFGVRYDVLNGPLKKDEVYRAVRQIKLTDTRWHEATEKADGARKAWREASDAHRVAVSAHAVRERDLYLEVMREVRPTGTGDMLTFKSKSRSGKPLEVQNALKDATDVYPQEWVETLGQKRILAHGSAQRGYYSDGSTAKIVLSDSVSIDGVKYRPVAVHELAHGMEAVVPDLMTVEHSFYWQRCEGESTVGMAWSNKERAREDKWHDRYVGRDYSAERRRGMAAAPDENYEIVSMGMDTMFGLRARDVVMDDEYRDWLVGVWLTF